MVISMTVKTNRESLIFLCAANLLPTLADSQENTEAYWGLGRIQAFEDENIVRAIFENFLRPVQPRVFTGSISVFRASAGGGCVILA